MPAIRRSRPLSERLKDYLNPYDFLIWLSEELETSDYPWEQWAYVLGAACNFVFMLARANSARKPYDDVFEDNLSGGIITAFASLTSYILIAACLSNAIYTFIRKRHYRLFEKPVEGAAPSTPSAKRVRVDSSPVASSPLRFVSSLFTDESIKARAHPDTKRDVWEIAVWDPTPVNLRFFCAFSPGHALLYWLFIPTSPTDPRPSVTVATTMFLAALLSAQLIMMQQQFSQQSKDTAYVHREVMNEYDTKFVHPRTQPVMRDVGIQFDEENDTLNTVEAYRPVTIVNRGFKPNPNPNYTGFIDPDHGLRGTPSRPVSDLSNVMALRSPAAFTPSSRSSTGRGDGGSLGVYTNARSPLKKAAMRQSLDVGTDAVLQNKRTGYSGRVSDMASPRYPR